MVHLWKNFLYLCPSAMDCVFSFKKKKGFIRVDSVVLGVDFFSFYWGLNTTPVMMIHLNVIDSDNNYSRFKVKANFFTPNFLISECDTMAEEDNCDTSQESLDGVTGN